MLELDYKVANREEQGLNSASMYKAIESMRIMFSEGIIDSLNPRRSADKPLNVTVVDGKLRVTAGSAVIGKHIINFEGVDNYPMPTIASTYIVALGYLEEVIYDYNEFKDLLPKATIVKPKLAIYETEEEVVGIRLAYCNVFVDGLTIIYDVNYSNAEFSLNRPWACAIDSLHRQELGSGVPTSRNPHGISFNDISSSFFDNLTSSCFLNSRIERIEYLISDKEVLYDIDGKLRNRLNSIIGADTAIRTFQYIKLKHVPTVFRGVFDDTTPIRCQWIKNTDIVMLESTSVNMKVGYDYDTAFALKDLVESNEAVCISNGKIVEYKPQRLKQGMCFITDEGKLVASPTRLTKTSLGSVKTINITEKLIGVSRLKMKYTPSSIVLNIEVKYEGSDYTFFARKFSESFAEEAVEELTGVWKSVARKVLDLLVIATTNQPKIDTVWIEADAAVTTYNSSTLNAERLPMYTLYRKNQLPREYLIQYEYRYLLNDRAIKTNVVLDYCKQQFDLKEYYIDAYKQVSGSVTEQEYAEILKTRVLAHFGYGVLNEN